MNAPKSPENRHGFLHYTELSRRLRESEIVRRAAMLRQSIEAAARELAALQAQLCLVGKAVRRDRRQ